MEINKSLICTTIALCIILVYCTSSMHGKKQGQGRLIHGKYFGPLNETSIFPKDFRHTEVEIGWISQPLDHFNKSDMRKWNQKYARNYTFFQPDGPACIFVSAESRMDERWIVLGQPVNYCRDLNGVLYMLEHRFYGESRPTPDATVENLKFLSVNQALQDTARFIEFVKFNEIHKIGKIILFGGSYGGSLVAYLRQKFPHSVDISVATSGPIIWKVDFIEYMVVVGKVLKQYGDCYNVVNSGMKEIERIISEAVSSNYQYPINNRLEPIKLCGDFYVKNTMDVFNFYSDISTVFGYYAQYNTAGNHEMSVKEICEHTFLPQNGTQSDFHVVANLLNLMNNHLGYDCFEPSNDEFCDFINKTSWEDSAVQHGSRMWQWQVCNEMASFQTTNAKNQPFVGLDTKLFINQCQCAFGNQYTEKYIQNAVRRHISLYGTFHTPRPNVIYVNGELDPWSPLGVVRQQQIPPYYQATNNSMQNNCVILIKGASHCNDIQPDRPSDSLDLQHARTEILKCIKNWMHH